MQERFEREAMPHLDAIYRTAVRMTGDRSRAADMAQEVFLQAWKAFGRYQEGTNCKAWLFQILCNTVRHQRRKEERYWQDPEAGEGTFARLPAAPLRVHELTDEELLRCMDRLPAAYREVLVLVDVEELSYREAAEALRIPAGTVMSRLSRARAGMREMLAPRPDTKNLGAFGIGTAACSL